MTAGDMAVMAWIDVVIENFDVAIAGMALSLEHALFGEQWKRREWILSGAFVKDMMLATAGKKL